MESGQVTSALLHNLVSGIITLESRPHGGSTGCSTVAILVGEITMHASLYAFAVSKQSLGCSVLVIHDVSCLTMHAAAVS